MRVGIIAEGRGDLAVLSNIVRAVLGVDFEDIQFLLPEYVLDQTDLHAAVEGELGGWGRVKKACIDGKLLKEFFEESLEDTCAIIHIDTAESHHDGFDVKRPDRRQPDYAQVLHSLVSEKLAAWTARPATEPIAHAVAVEEIDAWILASFTDRKETGTIADPKKALRTILNRQLSKAKLKRLSQLSTFREYDELSSGFRKPKNIDEYSINNLSLRLFVERLRALQKSAK